LVPFKFVLMLLRPPAVKAYGATRKQATRVKRYGRNKIRKTAREWGILRRKV